MGLEARLVTVRMLLNDIGAIPNHPLILLLPDVFGHAAIYLPVLNVIAKASAMSFWIAAGIVAFLFAGPTQTFVTPICSNSLGPSCAISAPETKDSTTFVESVILNVTPRQASV